MRLPSQTPTRCGTCTKGSPMNAFSEWMWDAGRQDLMGELWMEILKTGVACILENSKHWGRPSQLGANCKDLGVSLSQNKALHRFPLTKFWSGRETDRPQRPPRLSCGEQPEAPAHFRTNMATSVRHQDFCCLLYLFLPTTPKSFVTNCPTISAEAS